MRKRLIWEKWSRCFSLQVYIPLWFTLRHVYLVLPRPTGGNHGQRHALLVLPSFVHHPIVTLLPYDTMRRSGRGGGGGSDYHGVVWLVGRIVWMSTLRKQNRGSHWCHHPYQFFVTMMACWQKWDASLMLHWCFITFFMRLSGGTSLLPSE